MHYASNEDGGIPFDPTKGYIHVFDDTTLAIVMRTLDSITDFVSEPNVQVVFLSATKENGSKTQNPLTNTIYRHTIAIYRIDDFDTNIALLQFQEVLDGTTRYHKATAYRVLA